MKFLMLTLLVSLSGFASANTQNVQELSAILAQGSYVGVSETGEKCNVGVTVTEDSYSISVTPESFKFGRDDGSVECMYSKACFKLNARSEILNKKDKDRTYLLEIKKPAGGADRASSRKMKVTFKKTNSGLQVNVLEKIGLLNLSTTEATCTLK